MNIKESDIKFGLERETELLPVIQKHLNEPTLKKIEYKYSLYDFVNSDHSVYVELKARRENYECFYAAIVGSNKVMQALKYYKENKEVYFFFAYPNGLFYWKFNPDELSFFNFNDFHRKDTNERGNYLFIPIGSLIQVFDEEEQKE